MCNYGDVALSRVGLHGINKIPRRLDSAVTQCVCSVASRFVFLCPTVLLVNFICNTNRDALLKRTLTHSVNLQLQLTVVVGFGRLNASVQLMHLFNECV